MSEAFIGEIRMVSFTFAPRGWAMCDGQLLAINQNQALFSLLGTTYGGDGTTNFALPDLRGRMPVHFGNGVVEGQRAGEENHTLTLAELPTHSHSVAAGGTGTTASPAGALWADGGRQAYGGPANAPMAASAVAAVGGSQPHPNMAPYLVLNFAIALFGVFPSRE